MATMERMTTICDDDDDDDDDATMEMMRSEGMITKTPQGRLRAVRPWSQRLRLRLRFILLSA